jgi:drug/metabolite transporter (DMT)-like permease
MAVRRSQLPSTLEGTHRTAFGAIDWLGLAVPALIWGCSFVFIAEALDAFSPGLIVAGRIGFGAVALSLVPSARRTRIPRSEWGRFALLGLTWMALPFACFSIAQQWIDSALAGMLNATMPLITCVISATMLRRAPRRRQTIGLLVGCVGAVLIAAPEFAAPEFAGAGSRVSSGVALVMLAVCSYSFSANVSIPLTQAYGSVAVIWRTQLAAIVWSAPFGLRGLDDIDFAWLPLLALIALGVGGTAVAQLLAAHLMARVGATRGSMITYAMPIVSILAGVVLRSETVAVVSLAGIAIVLVGAALASRSEL